MKRIVEKPGGANEPGKVWPACASTGRGEGNF